MGHIFISYSHKDKDYVHKLQNVLQNEGFEVWIDDRIDYGEEWPTEIELRLDQCEAFILVVSENAKKSKWVQNEVRRAERTGKPFFPLVLQGDPWLYIESIQWFDVKDGSVPDEKFFRRLANFATRRKSSVERQYEPKPVGQTNAQRVERLAERRTTTANTRAVSPTYVTIGGVVIVALLGLIFGINYLLNIPASVTPTETVNSTPFETAVISTSTETKNPPTRTLVPPAFTPTPGIGSIFMSDGVTMLYVPAGTFSMGSEKDNDEKPIHSVDLDGYYMDKYEVTNAAYKRCVDAGTCAAPKESKSYTRPAYYGNFEFDEFPVIYVDWNMAKTYCEWRDSRLPTEAEWEKAARGTDGRTYPWGEDISCDKLNYNNCTGDTTKVGSYLDGVSPYGLYDMAGNVWEWVSDWYDGKYYQNSPSSNPLGAASGSYRVLRGGSWNYVDNVTRSSYRFNVTPDYISNGIGFRCARSLP